MIAITVTDRHDRIHTVEAQAGDLLMEVLREFDWGVAATCGGMCSCATCHVYVDKEWLAKFPQCELDELDLLEFLDFFQDYSRLSCQLELRSEHDGLHVKLAPEE